MAKITEYLNPLNWFTTKGSKLPPGAMIPARNTGNGRMVMINGTVTWIPDDQKSYIVNGYAANVIVYGIINMIMDKVRVAPWNIYQIESESDLKLYNSFVEQKDFVNALKYKRKALRPVNSTDVRIGKLKELLQWANEQETYNDFFANGVGLKLITGNRFTWADLIPSGANSNMPNELWNLPPQYTSIIATRGFPQRVTGYQLSTVAFRKFMPNEVLHERLFNPEYNAEGSSMYGMSPLKAANRSLTRNNAAKKAASVQFDNNGAPGIVYVDDPLLEDTSRGTQAKLISDRLQEEYSGADNFNKVPVSGYKMGYVSIGSTLKDMALTEVEEVDLRQIANAFGLPSQLLNDPANKTFNNQKEAEKALTSRCAMPHIIGNRNYMNKKLQTDWGMKGKKIYIDTDLTVYPELMEDQKEKVDWLVKIPGITPAYIFEQLGLDVPEDANYNIPLVGTGWQTLADMVNTMSEQDVNSMNEELLKAGIKY